MATTGTSTVNFGSKATDTTTVVTGQAAITGSSWVEAWVFPATTASNTVDNHWFEDLQVVAGNVVNGVGFTIYAKTRTGFAHGIYNIGWVYT
jgi:hypothetical protein